MVARLAFGTSGLAKLVQVLQLRPIVRGRFGRSLNSSLMSHVEQPGAGIYPIRRTGDLGLPHHGCSDGYADDTDRTFKKGMKNDTIR